MLAEALHMLFSQKFKSIENEFHIYSDSSCKLNIFVAREASRAIQRLTPHQRAEVIYKLAELLEDKQNEILDENQKDIDYAKNSTDLQASLVARLALSPGKLKVLSSGLKQIAESSYGILNRTVKAMQVAEGLELKQITVPIGVLMVLFESRPDALPQVSKFLVC